MKKLDLKDQEYNRVKVLREHPERRHGYVQWVCECRCGKEFVVPGVWVKRGTKRSCGCCRENTIVGLAIMNPKARPFSETWPVVLEGLKQGLLIREIAPLLDISPTGVGLIIRRARGKGIKVPKTRTPISEAKARKVLEALRGAKVVLPDRWQELKRLLEAGKTTGQVAWKMNVTPQRVHQIMKQVLEFANRKENLGRKTG